MMKRSPKAAMLVCIFLANTQDVLANPFAAVQSLRCDFRPGLSADWESGEPVLREGKFGGPVVFDSINFAKGTARMVGNSDTPDLALFVTDDGMTFVEWLDGDTLVATTVFAHHPGNDPSRYSAVHSRHKVVVHPLPSQYHGTCRILD